MKNTNRDGAVYHAMSEAESFACARLAFWGLHEWEFRWDHARRRLGACHYERKRITLSKHFVSLNPENGEQIADTVLHEIAHALAWMHDRERGHGDSWKAWCIRVGATPIACARDQAIASMPHRYVIRLRDTGEIVGRYYRKPRFCRYLKRMMLRGRPETKGMMELVELA